MLEKRKEKLRDIVQDTDKQSIMRNVTNTETCKQVFIVWRNPWLSKEKGITNYSHPLIEKIFFDEKKAEKFLKKLIETKQLYPDFFHMSQEEVT